MKKRIAMILLAVLAALAGLGTGKLLTEFAQNRTVPVQSVPAAETAGVTEAPETAAATLPETELPTRPATEPPSEISAETAQETQPVPVLTFTAEEEEMLLKLAMAERGDTGCATCMALVMRTVLNRVENPGFSSTVRGVIHAQDQFTPVMDGTFEQAEPDEDCEEALEMIRYGWDESQGALYYEWCEGESWHSRNLTLLFQHCDTRFYSK